MDGEGDPNANNQNEGQAMENQQDEQIQQQNVGDAMENEMNEGMGGIEDSQQNQ